MLARAAPLMESVVGPDAPPLLRAHLSRARCLLDQGRAAEALVLLEQLRRQLQPLGRDGAALRPGLDALVARATLPR